MIDRYAMINHVCCSNPKLQLIYEPSLGYEPFVCCLTCNHQTHFDEEKEFVQTGNGTVAQRLRELEEEE